MHFLKKMNTNQIIYACLFIVFLVVFTYSVYNRKDLIVTQEGKEDVYNEEFNNPPVATLTIYHVEWCGYCKRAMPEFKKVMRHHGQVFNNHLLRVNTVDCDKNPKLAEKEKIDSYPTIKLKLPNKTHTYQGERTKEGLFGYLKNML